MLTEKQQQIIDSLQSEFNRINESSRSGGSFNLIDIDALSTKSREIREFKEMVQKDKDSWMEAAKTEALRITNLLQKDIPDAVIVLGFENRLIKIFHKNCSGLSSNDTVTIKVKIIDKSIQDSYGNYYWVGKSLGYELCPTILGSNDYYYDIEKAVMDSKFLEALRKRVIDRG